MVWLSSFFWFGFQSSKISPNWKFQLEMRKWENCASSGCLDFVCSGRNLCISAEFGRCMDIPPSFPSSWKWGSEKLQYPCIVPDYSTLHHTFRVYLSVTVLIPSLSLEWWQSTTLRYTVPQYYTTTTLLHYTTLCYTVPHYYATLQYYTTLNQTTVVHHTTHTTRGFTRFRVYLLVTVLLLCLSGGSPPLHNTPLQYTTYTTLCHEFHRRDDNTTLHCTLHYYTTLPLPNCTLYSTKPDYSALHHTLHTAHGCTRFRVYLLVTVLLPSVFLFLVGIWVVVVHALVQGLCFLYTTSRATWCPVGSVV